MPPRRHSPERASSRRGGLLGPQWPRDNATPLAGRSGRNPRRPSRLLSAQLPLTLVDTKLLGRLSIPIHKLRVSLSRSPSTAFPQAEGIADLCAFVLPTTTTTAVHARGSCAGAVCRRDVRKRRTRRRPRTQRAPIRLGPHTTSGRPQREGLRGPGNLDVKGDPTPPAGTEVGGPGVHERGQGRGGRVGGAFLDGLDQRRAVLFVADGRAGESTGARVDGEPEFKAKRSPR